MAGYHEGLRDNIYCFVIWVCWPFKKSQSGKVGKNGHLSQFNGVTFHHFWEVNVELPVGTANMQGCLV